ncbi:hypothetical protein ACLQ9N_13095, partial [Gallibacterium anatis]|uniref:hypothetical protein n=1 Tax=Gallibacterium anatis TaxID=750 RepID=UPI0039FC4A16
FAFAFAFAFRSVSTYSVYILSSFLVLSSTLCASLNLTQAVYLLLFSLSLHFAFLAFLTLYSLRFSFALQFQLSRFR